MLLTSSARLNRSSPAWKTADVRRVQTRAFLKQLDQARTASKVKDSLTVLTAQSDRGVKTTPQELADIKECFAALESLNKRGTEKNICGAWSLVWTTEKEILFIIQRAGLFGTQAGDVYQTIDTTKGSLENFIEFPPEGSFVVDSSLSWDGEGRTSFEFQGAALNLPKGKTFNLPPFGKGWFDSVYCDGKIRLTRDVRGDLSMFSKR